MKNHESQRRLLARGCARQPQDGASAPRSSPGTAPVASRAGQPDEREREAVPALASPTVWIAVASRRGSAARSSTARRMPSALASCAASSAIAPPRTTLSMTIAVPGRERSSARRTYSGVVCLSASTKTRSNGPAPSAASAVEALERRADADLDDVGEPGALDVRARDLGVARVELERDEPAVRRQRPREPDRAVAAERPELEDRPRAADPGEQVQELALGRRDVDRRQARRRVRLERGGERLVRADERARRGTGRPRSSARRSCAAGYREPDRTSRLEPGRASDQVARSRCGPRSRRAITVADVMTSSEPGQSRGRGSATCSRRRA